MRILFINQFYCPDPAATGQLMADQAEELARRGHEVHVLCSARGYNGGSERYPARETLNGVHLHRVGATGFGRGRLLARLADYLSFYIIAVLRAVFLRRMDVCVCLTTPPFIGLVGAILKMLRGTQLVLWVMDIYPQIAVTYGVIKQDSLLNRALSRLSRSLYARSSRIISLGEVMTQRLIEAGADGDKIATVHNWVPRESIEPKPREQSQSKKHWGINGEPTFMYSGNLGLGHDLYTFVEAATLLQRNWGLGNGDLAVRDLTTKNTKDTEEVFVGGGPRNTRNSRTDGSIDHKEHKNHKEDVTEGISNGREITANFEFQASTSERKTWGKPSVFAFKMLFVGNGKGKGPLQEACADQDSDCIRFFPPQPLESLADSLAAGDVHLVSQKPGTEGLIVPSKIYGVLAAGRPTVFVGPEDCEPARIIRDSGAGIVVPSGDVEAAAKALWRLASNREMREEMGRRARAYYESHFGRERSVELISGAVESVGHQEFSPQRAQRPQRNLTTETQRAQSGQGTENREQRTGNTSSLLPGFAARDSQPAMGFAPQRTQKSQRVFGGLATAWRTKALPDGRATAWAGKALANGRAAAWGSKALPGGRAAAYGLAVLGVMGFVGALWGREIGTIAAQPFLTLWRVGLGRVVQDFSSSGTFWGLLVGSFALTTCLTPLAMVLARKIGAIDRGGHRKIGQRSMPLLGGLAVAVPFLIVCGLGMTGPTDLLGQIVSQRVPLWALLIGSVYILGVGIIDDTRGMRARNKFFAQVAGALFLCFCGFTIESLNVPFLGNIWLGPVLGSIVTILWVVGLTNALNIIDGLDGLASGVALISAIGLAVIGALNGALFTMLLCTALAGSLAAFLIFNFHPARIFLGDTGSLFLGFALSTISLTSSMKTPGTVIFLAPILALGVPLFEVGLSMLRRFARGLPISAADAGHIHHRLLKRGFSQRRVALIIYAAGIVCMLAALFSSTVSARNAGAMLLPLGMYALAMLVVGWLAGYYRDLGGSVEIRKRNVFYQSFVHYASTSLSSDVGALNADAILGIARAEMRLSFVSAAFLEPFQAIGSSWMPQPQSKSSKNEQIPQRTQRTQKEQINTGDHGIHGIHGMEDGGGTEISGQRTSDTRSQTPNSSEGYSPQSTARSLSVQEIQLKAANGEHIVIRYQHDGDPGRHEREEIRLHLGRIFEHSTIKRANLKSEPGLVEAEEEILPHVKGRPATSRPRLQPAAAMQDISLDAGIFGK